MSSQYEQLFADTTLPILFEKFGVPASYTPSGGAATDVTILVQERSKPVVDKSGARTNAYMIRASVRDSEVAEPGRGDTVQLTGSDIVYKINPVSVVWDGVLWKFEASQNVTTSVGDTQTMPRR